MFDTPQAMVATAFNALIDNDAILQCHEIMTDDDILIELERNEPEELLHLI